MGIAKHTIVMILFSQKVFFIYLMMKYETFNIRIISIIHIKTLIWIWISLSQQTQPEYYPCGEVEWDLGHDGIFLCGFTEEVENEIYLIDSIYAHMNVSLLRMFWGIKESLLQILSCWKRNDSRGSEWDRYEELWNRREKQSTRLISKTVFPINGSSSAIYIGNFCFK